MSRFMAALTAWREDYDAIDPYEGPEGLHYRGTVLLETDYIHAERVQELIESMDELTSEPLFHTLDTHKEGHDA